MMNMYLDWWYNRPDDTNIPTLDSDTIPPPAPAPLAVTSGTIRRGHCPLCRDKLGTGAGDTLATVSALVFCYSCIVQHVR